MVFYGCFFIVKNVHSAHFLDAASMLTKGGNYFILVTGEKMISRILFRKPIEISEEKAKMLFATKLFEEQKVSLEKASEIAEVSLNFFIEILSRKNIPVINYPVEQLREDIANA